MAAMTGAVLCTPEFLLTPPGVVVQLKRGLSLPRHIFVSQACQGCHPGMIDLMRRVCQLTEKACRWTWYLEADGAQRQQVFFLAGHESGAATTARKWSLCLRPAKFAMLLSRHSLIA